MDIVLVVGLFCALIFLLHASDKNVEKSLPVEPPKVTIPLPQPERFVSVVFKEGQTKLYDYFIGNNYDLKVGDFVEVPVNSRYNGREIKIALIKYVGRPGEYSKHARATVIRKAYAPPQNFYNLEPPRKIPLSQPVYKPRPTQTFSSQSVKPIPQPVTTDTFTNDKRFVQVIFKKNGKKRFDYFLGDIHDVRVGDFVVVHVNNNGQSKWKIAKVLYVSSPGEISLYANSAIIKKADYPKW